MKFGVTPIAWTATFDLDFSQGVCSAKDPDSDTYCAIPVAGGGTALHLLHACHMGPDIKNEGQTICWKLEEGYGQQSE